jgi:hypothetical protein
MQRLMKELEVAHVYEPLTPVDLARAMKRTTKFKDVGPAWWMRAYAPRNA